jgi:hypothetical protein
MPRQGHTPRPEGGAYHPVEGGLRWVVASSATAELTDSSPDSTHEQKRGDGDTGRGAVGSPPLYLTP